MGETKEKARQHYQGSDGRAYHQRVHAMDDFTLDVLARGRARKLQPYLSPNDEVLEFGAGMGFNLWNLQCARRVAFDVSDAGQALSTSKGIEFKTNLDDLPQSGKGQFSVVICHHVLEHVPDPWDSLETLRSLLRPKGRLLLFVPYESSSFYRTYHPNDPNNHLYSWNPNTLGRLVHSVGFEILKAAVTPFGYERRLAWLERYGGWAYALGLKMVRTLRPENEVTIEARKPAE